MRSDGHPLHIAFLPCMAPGHMLPMLDMAKLFAFRGVAATIITTPLNAPVVRASFQRPLSSSGQYRLHLHLVTPPPTFDARENLAFMPTTSEKLSFVMSLHELRPRLEEAFLEIRPDAIVTDMFFPWTSAFARDVLGVPRFVFHGTNLFSLCGQHSFDRHNPLESSPANEESFLLPELPHRIKLFKSQVIDPRKIPREVAQLLFHETREAELNSNGVILNSCHEVEPEYAKCYADYTGKRTWFVGPVSLCNVDEADLLTRGDPDNSGHSGVLKFLDSKPRGSVLYICFGSISRFGSAQLHEIAMSLESANCPFIWVVRHNDSREWLTDGLEQKILEGGGMIIRGWAPQVLILGHVAIGGFLTHCGWNSCLEGISAGVPMVTCPLFAEQFYNERLLVDVLRVGVAVGNRCPMISDDDEERVLVGREGITTAVKTVMDGGDEAREIKRRATDLSEKAKKAMEEGGSSYEGMSHFIQELGRKRI